MSIRVLIADDQSLVRAGFRLVLSNHEDIEVVGAAANGNQAIDGAARLDPHVVLMDIRMPELDGISATRAITARGPARVLVLTTYDLDEYVYDALQAGASGFLLKDAPEDQLLAAIRVVAAGGALFSPSVTRRLIEEFSRRRAPSGPPEGLRSLTEREAEVLTHLARGESNAEIAAALFLSEATVKAHVSRLLTRLDLNNRVQIAMLVHDAGLR